MPLSFYARSGKIKKNKNAKLKNKRDKIASVLRVTHSKCQITVVRTHGL